MHTYCVMSICTGFQQANHAAPASLPSCAHLQPITPAAAASASHPPQPKCTPECEGGTPPG